LGTETDLGKRGVEGDVRTPRGGESRGRQYGRGKSAPTSKVWGEGNVKKRAHAVIQNANPKKKPREKSSNVLVCGRGGAIRKLEDNWTKVRVNKEDRRGVMGMGLVTTQRSEK